MRIFFAILILVLISSLSLRGEAAAYLLVSTAQGGGDARHFRGVIQDPRPASQFSPVVSWDDLARRIFWPQSEQGLPNIAGSEFLFSISDPALPTVSATMRLSASQAMKVGNEGCNAFSMTIAGSMQPVLPEQSAKGIRAISVSGDGQALLCDGEKLPHAAFIRLSRTVQPELWNARSPDEEIKSEIELAWARSL